MADIELVIKISEDRYKDIQSYDWKNAERLFSEEWRSIHNGRLLPKGHGRLIDADELKRIIQGNDVLNMTGFNVRICDINATPTIIEADKESEGKLSWLGKNCKDCGNEKCKKLGTLPKGYDCALWQGESEVEE